MSSLLVAAYRTDPLWSLVISPDLVFSFAEQLASTLIFIVPCGGGCHLAWATTELLACNCLKFALLYSSTNKAAEDATFTGSKIVSSKTQVFFCCQSFHKVTPLSLRDPAAANYWTEHCRDMYSKRGCKPDSFCCITLHKKVLVNTLWQELFSGTSLHHEHFTPICTTFLFNLEREDKNRFAATILSKQNVPV